MKEVFDATNERMEKCLIALERDYSSIRAGRANPKVLDKIQIDYYGVSTAINQMAGVSVPDARTIVIQPWDASSLKSIEKAIQMADIGINPQNDGKVLRLIFPPLTEDHRKTLVKEVAKRAEDCKISIRNVRRESIDELKKKKKEGDITEDDLKDGEKELQEITDKFTKKCDEISANKQTDILSM